VPWVVLGYAFMALYYSPTNLLSITEGRSKVIGIATVTGAAANIGLNIALIPLFGIHGAAATTTLTYLIMFVGVTAIAGQDHVVPMQTGRLIRLIGVALLIFGVGWEFAPDNLLMGIVVKSGVLVTFPLILWGSGFYSPKEKNYIRSLIVR
jgi:O-antigen/teichoic acid export membrane protein